MQSVQELPRVPPSDGFFDCVFQGLTLICVMHVIMLLTKPLGVPSGVVFFQRCRVLEYVYVFKCHTVSGVLLLTASGRLLFSLLYQFSSLLICSRFLEGRQSLFLNQYFLDNFRAFDLQVPLKHFECVGKFYQ